jgi:hypothetical protein
VREEDLYREVHLGKSSGLRNYQAIEEPILKGEEGGKAVYELKWYTRL